MESDEALIKLKQVTAEANELKQSLARKQAELGESLTRMVAAYKERDKWEQRFDALLEIVGGGDS